MADKQTYTFSNDITTVEVSSLGAKIVVIPQDRADIYVEYDNPKDSPEFCAVLSGKTLTLKECFSFTFSEASRRGLHHHGVPAAQDL